MSASSDFERYIAACDFPGAIHADLVQEHLKGYVSALGIERQIVQIERGWQINQHPALERYVNSVLDELLRRNPVEARAARQAMDVRAARDARAARDVRVARDARDAMDARAAREARAAMDAMEARAAMDAMVARAAREARAAMDAMEARAAMDAMEARAAMDSRDARDAMAAMDASGTRALHKLAAWCIDPWTWWHCRFDLSWLATTHLGAQQLGNAEVDRWAAPLFEAYIAGCWMLHWTDDVLYWVAKPTIHLEMANGSKRLHADDRGAIECVVEDLYFWHGVLVPDFVVINPESITVQHIEQEDNTEVRRVLIERMGYARYILESGAQLIHSDETGALYRKEIPNDEPLVAVHVLNSTPEPDGSVKRYMIRVPPNMERAREAVAWTFNIPEEEYRPVVET